MFTALTLFGIAFGYVEAAVVAYLRLNYEPLHRRLHPDCAAGDLFPIIRLDQLESAGPEYRDRLYIELGREAATMVMLAAVALALALNLREWLAAFMIAFGIWDIFFYVFLRVMIAWPTSVFEWDLLFLLPVPWVGPIWAPLIVSVTMIFAGATVLWRESLGRPVRPPAVHWATMLLGGALIVLAFCWDYRNITAGRPPNPFSWPLFFAGEMLGILAFLHGLRIGSFVPSQSGETLPVMRKFRRMRRVQ